MLLDKNKSCLLVVDVQTKLTSQVNNAKHMIQRCEWLMRLASELDVPVLACEQYPKGLGYTIEPLRSLLPMHLPFHPDLLQSGFGIMVMAPQKF